MTGQSSALRALKDAARRMPDLDLLLLFGSRARGDASEGSDWDLGYIGGERLDVASLLDQFVAGVGTDHVDLVDLRRASGLLRYRAARDGQVLLEARRGLADAFRLEAAQFWCDAGPVLQQGYEDVLAELTP
jgi:predicted nucleotidyltransferase